MNNVTIENNPVNKLIEAEFLQVSMHSGDIIAKQTLENAAFIHVAKGYRSPFYRMIDHEIRLLSAVGYQIYRSSFPFRAIDR